MKAAQELMGIYAETVCCCKYSPFIASSVQKESCFFCPAIIKTFYILTEEAKGTAALSSHAKSYEMTVKGNPLKSLVRPRCLLTDRFLLISIHCTPARFQHFEPSNSSLFSLFFFFCPHRRAAGLLVDTFTKSHDICQA